MSNSYPHAKIQTSAWQCSALCKAQVKAYLGVFRVTVNSPSVTRIHNLLAIFYFEVFIYSAAELAIPYNFLQLMLTITCTHYDCMRIALSLRVHHRAQRLFTIPLRGSAINTEQLCQSIRRFQNFTVRRAICPYCTVGSRLRTDHRCCRAICPYCTVGSFGRHFLLNVMWHGFDQSLFKYILRCYIKYNVNNKSVGPNNPCRNITVLLYETWNYCTVDMQLIFCLQLCPHKCFYLIIMPLV